MLLKTLLSSVSVVVLMMIPMVVYDADSWRCLTPGLEITVQVSAPMCQFSVVTMLHKVSPCVGTSVIDLPTWKVYEMMTTVKLPRHRCASHTRQQLTSMNWQIYWSRPISTFYQSTYCTIHYILWYVSEIILWIKKWETYCISWSFKFFPGSI